MAAPLTGTHACPGNKVTDERTQDRHAALLGDLADRTGGVGQQVHRQLDAFFIEKLNRRLTHFSLEYMI